MTTRSAQLGRVSTACLAVIMLAGCGASSYSRFSSEEPEYKQPGHHQKPPVHQTNNQSSSPVIGGVALPDNANIELGMPKASGKAEVLISRSQYVLSWNPRTHIINWAAWRLSADDLGKVPRQNDFAVDPDLSTYLAANGGGRAVGASDYADSCMDRGHQTPSGDRTDNQTDNRATFLMSNIIPQTAFLNRGPWEHLESYTRSQAQASTDSAFFIVTGTIFSSDPGTIGPNGDIAVPSKNFKVVVKSDSKMRSKPEVIASVIMPNVTSSGTDPLADHAQACTDSHGIAQHEAVQDVSTDWKQYDASLSEIEAESGIDLSYLE